MPRASDPTLTPAELVARLTPNQLACMRLVQRRLDSEQIAYELGIPKTAVNDRIRNAVAKLGAPNRREAARILDLADAEAGVEPPPLPAAPEAQPNRADFGEVEPRPDPSFLTAPDQQAAAAPPGNRLHEPSAAIWRYDEPPTPWAPLRRNGARFNDLTTLQRLAWMLAIPLVLAMAFGVFAIGMKVLADLIWSLFGTA